MEHKAISIRPFIGAKNFNLARNFYNDIGFTEVVIAHNMSYFHTGKTGFYLQDAYVKDWVDNTMIFLEVDDVHRHWNEMATLNLPAKYDTVRLIPIRELPWGKEYFLHDPSGILWHIGEFLKNG